MAALPDLRDPRSSAVHGPVRPVPTTGATRPRASLPVITTTGAVVREVRTSDAAVLTETLAPGRAVIGVPPATTVDDMRRFITWAHLERAAGRAVCYAVLPSRDAAPVGVVLARRVERGFAMAEWSYCAIAEG
ncbi:MAG: hypothetical protein HOP14_03720, partial [Acidobacteria bacterium]|nr:hypothetical protein [Acidobacteriota bacterium]